MEDTTSYTEILEKSLGDFRDYIESKVLPVLRENFRVYQTTFENLYGILLRKGLIKEDPYKYEEKISEISIPPKGPFTQSEKVPEMSHRLSAFHSQIDFLNNYYSITLDYLTLKEMKKLVGLIKYIDWPGLTSNSSNSTTTAIANYCEQIKKGTDNLASGIINDSVKQMSKLTADILSILRTITVYHRENYKLEFRKHISTYIEKEVPNITPESENTLKIVKKYFKQEMPGFPYYPDLVKEVLLEDYSESGSKLRESVLEKIAVRDTKPKKREKKEPPLKQLLLDGLKIIAASGVNLSDAMNKLSINSSTLEHKKLNFSEKFKRWILKSVYKEDDSPVYEIEYFNTATGTAKSEKIKFNKFKSEVMKKTSLFSKILSKTAPISKRLEMVSDEQLLELLSKNIAETQIIHRRMESLNTYFLTEVPREKRQMIKGIKLELGAIKNAIIKSNKKRYEYVSLKEEREQLKKLGVENID